MDALLEFIFELLGYLLKLLWELIKIATPYILGLIIIIIIIEYLKELPDTIRSKKRNKLIDNLKNKIKIDTEKLNVGNISPEIYEEKELIEYDTEYGVIEKKLERYIYDNNKCLEYIQSKLGDKIKENNMNYYFDRYNRLTKLESYDYMYKFINENCPISKKNILRLTDTQNKLLTDLHDEINLSRLDIYSTNKGIEGEALVMESLNLFSDRYKILENIRIEIDEASSESDVIIITEKGVFVVEIKNYGVKGDTIEITEDGTWIIKKANGNSTQKNSVSAQNVRHCALNQKLINKELKALGYDGEYIECNSIITFPSNEVRISNKSYNTVLRPLEIITYIKKFKPDFKLSNETQEQIAKIFNDNNLGAKEYPIELRYNKVKALVNRIYMINKYFEIIDTYFMMVRM